MVVVVVVVVVSLGPSDGGLSGRKTSLVSVKLPKKAVGDTSS